MALALDTIPDYVNALLPHFVKRDWVDISLDLQNYLASALFLSPKGGDTALSRDGAEGTQVQRIQLNDGSGYAWILQVANLGNARNVGMFENDVLGIKDLNKRAFVPMRFQTTNWSYDAKEEIFQKEPSVIVDSLSQRENAAWNNMCELNEQNLWGTPTSSSDETTPWGIGFWIQKNNSATAGFIGGNPSGFSDTAGVSRTTYANWCNYAGGYTDVTQDDLIDKVDTANYKTDFHAPHVFPSALTGIERAIFTVHSVRQKMRKLAAQQNDDIGWDVIAGQKMLMLGSIPVIRVPYLDANDTSNPVYGIDLTSFKPMVNQNVDMAKMTRTNPFKHTVTDVHYDHGHNYICLNGRRNWVFSV